MIINTEWLQSHDEMLLASLFRTHSNNFDRMITPNFKGRLAGHGALAPVLMQVSSQQELTFFFATSTPPLSLNILAQ